VCPPDSPGPQSGPQCGPPAWGLTQLLLLPARLQTEGVLPRDLSTLSQTLLSPVGSLLILLLLLYYYYYYYTTTTTILLLLLLYYYYYYYYTTITTTITTTLLLLYYCYYTTITMITFTLRVFIRCFYPKRLTKSTCVEGDSNISLWYIKIRIEQVYSIHSYEVNRTSFIIAR